MVYLSAETYEGLAVWIINSEKKLSFEFKAKNTLLTAIIPYSILLIWAQLFKANDVVS